MRRDIKWPENFSIPVESNISHLTVKGRSSRHKHRNQNTIKAFLLYLDKISVYSITNVTSEQASGYISSLVGYAPKTIAVMISILRCFFRYLYTNEMITFPLSESLPKVPNCVRTILPTVWSKGEIEKLKNHIIKIKKTMVVIVTTSVLITSIIFIIYVNFFQFAINYNDAILPFYILIFGIGYSSFLYWGSGLLAMTGYPEEFSKLMAVMLSINILGNILLIPIFGINGAALATSVSYIIMISDMKRRIKNKINLKI